MFSRIDSYATNELLLFGKTQKFVFMKNLSCIFLILFSLTFINCSSDDSSNDQEEVYLRFTVNGQFQYSYEPETITSLQILIRGDEGMSDTFKSISLWLPTTFTEGSHLINDAPTSDEEAYTANYVSVPDGIDIQAASGTMIITSVSEEFIQGTFEFVGNNNGETITISNGEFKAYR